MINIQKVKVEEIPRVKELLSFTWVDTYESFLSPAAILKVTSIWHDPKRLMVQAQDSKLILPWPKTNKEK